MMTHEHDKDVPDDLASFDLLKSTLARFEKVRAEARRAFTAVDALYLDRESHPFVDPAWGLKRRPFDQPSYVQRVQNGPCFICDMVAGSEEHRKYVIHQDDLAVVFLNRYPVLYGYTLVAPTRHREQVTGDFTLDEYLALQVVVHRVAEAVRLTVPTERLYVVSLGSQQGNRHVHWHIAPLPYDVPYDEQQLAALDFGRGYLNLGDSDLEWLKEHIRQAMNLGLGIQG